MDLGLYLKQGEDNSQEDEKSKYLKSHADKSF